MENPKNLKIVFFGNTKYSVFDLEALQEKFGVSLVVTIPDRPSGRKRELKPSPVKKFAIVHNIPVMETGRLDEPAIDKIKDLLSLRHSQPFDKTQGKLREESKKRSFANAQDNGGGLPDFLVVADYGLIFPESLLEIPKYASLNIHHSILPKYRGPSPAPSAILNGERISGVTIISMTEIVDAGDMLAQKEYVLKPDETSDSLLIQLNKIGGELVCKVIRDYVNGKENPCHQDDKVASYTQRFTKQDGFIDLDNPPDPQTLDRMIRAFYPWPGVWTKLRIKNYELRIKILPGNMIQPEGKRSMTVNEFKNGYPKAYEQIKHLFNEKAQS